ncbi:hypothetical protein BASA81_007367 [Batrachochytrium salamandrivorans]|nr:hypothetical protein BASA81_007367 [Batrachochytrium salamandrivorans]
MSKKKSASRPRRASMGEVFGETPLLSPPTTPLLADGFSLDYEDEEFEISASDVSTSPSWNPSLLSSSPMVAPSTTFSPMQIVKKKSTLLSSTSSAFSASTAPTTMDEIKFATEAEKQLSLANSAAGKFSQTQFLERKRRDRRSSTASTIGRSRLASSSIVGFRMEDDLDEPTPIRYYLHVRHVTPAVNNVKLWLKASLFSESGEKLGKTTLTNCQEQGCLNAGECMFHLMGPITLYSQYPEIGYVQLKKRWGGKINMKQVADVFIQDISLKRDVRLAPDTDVVAYFRFCGVVLENAHVVIRNLLAPHVSHKKHLTVLKEIVKSKQSKAKFLQDKLLPEIEWADTSKPKPRTLRSKASLLYKGLGMKLEMDYRSTEETMPYQANCALALTFNPHFFDGVPGFAKFPTRDLTFSAIKFEEFYSANIALDTLAFAKSCVPDKNPTAICFVDFSRFMLDNLRIQQNHREVLETKHIVTNYSHDEELSRQYLEGLFCTQIQLLRMDSPIKTKHSWILNLCQEANADPHQRIFFVDYAKLIDIPRNREEGGYFAPARCIFQLNSNNVLLPLAISLYYDSDKQWKTHLPNSASWKVAKLFLKCAAGQEHQLVSHALQTHLCVEPFAIALERKVPLHHLYYRILKPHFRYTLDLNFKSKTLLLNDGGRWDYIGATGGVDAGHVQFIMRHFREWTFDQMCLPDDLRRRGFECDPNLPDEEELPGYMYAKDGMMIWNYLYEWIENLVWDTFGSEEAFTEDEVSKEYFREVEREGFAGMPTFHPESRADLVKVLCGVVYTATVTHAAVNFPQFAQYGFVANSPLILSKPAPLPGEICVVTPYLPNENQCLKAMRAVWGLSRFTLDDERFLLAVEVQHFYNLSLWNDPRYRAHCQRFGQQLQALEAHMQQRPKTVYGTKYLWLLPSTIPTSITT